MPNRTTRPSRRERLLLAMPAPLIEWPFESAMFIYGLVAGSALLTGLVDSSSVAALFPHWASHALGFIFLLGALDIGWGLYRKAYYIVVPRGLRLIAVAIAAYTITIVASGGLTRSFAAVLIIGGVAVLCSTRSLYLRGKAEIVERVRLWSQ